MSSTQYRGPLLTLIRHGETEGNVAHIIQGQTDSPLSARGRAQVLALGKHWRPERASNHQHEEVDGQDGEKVRARIEKCLNGLPIPTAIITSPTGRARTTATSVFLACRELASDPSFAEDGTIDQASVVPTLPLSSSARSSERRDLQTDSALTTKLVLDPLLMELDFGSREGTRRGMHVPGFPKSSSPGESREAFARRLRDAGECWLAAAGMTSNTVNRFGRPVSAVAKDGKGSKNTTKNAGKSQTGSGDEIAQAAKETIKLEREMQGESLPGAESEDLETGAPARKRLRKGSVSASDHEVKPVIEPSAAETSSEEGSHVTTPAAQGQALPAHVVLVTHGMAISTFLNCFQPAMDKSSSVLPASYPFPSNTGYFTIGIRPIQRLSATSADKSKAPSSGQMNTDKMELFLLRANETAHLATAGLGGSPRRGASKQEKGLQSISSFFSKK